ncbi:MAG: hypothetical protein ACJ76P_02215 [Actinomycetota bacterium]
MRYEFERNGDRLGSVLWEGPGQVSVDVHDDDLRARFERHLAGEVIYLDAKPFPSGWDPLQTRRRDWTPWEFERACRALASGEQMETHRVPSGSVQFREEVPSR